MEFKCILSAKFACGAKRKATKGKLSQTGTQEVGVPAVEPELVKEGWLRKRSGCIKNWRDRYFVLRDDGSLLGFKTRPEPGVYSGASSNFTVRGCQVMVKESPEKFAFSLRTLRGEKRIERTFSAVSRNELMEWLEAIKLVNGVLDASMPEKAPALKRRKHAGKITADDFELLQTLGKGAFGKVVLARERSSELPRAIKIIRKETVATKEQAKQILTEKRVLQKSNHPFLVALKCSFQTEDRLCFVMEFANGGELFFHFASERRFSEEKTRFYGAEILLALEYLHRRKVIYRDLKLENLLLDGDGHIKLTDFGFCKEGMSYGKRTATFCGTAEYMAPEILEGDGYGLAVDWWSFGTVLYELMTGTLPFASRECEGTSSNRAALYRKILHDKVQIPPSLSSRAKTLLGGLLTKNPKFRLGGSERDAEEIKQHSFFRGVQWQAVLAKEMAPPFKPEVTSDTDVRYFDTEVTEESVSLEPLEKSGSKRTRMSRFRKFSYSGNGKRRG